MNNRDRNILLGLLFGTGLITVAALVFCRKTPTKVKPVQVPETEAIPVLTRSKSKYFRKKPKPQLKILENYGAGDCLFNCFVQAVKSIGSLQENVSVQTLRSAVAKEMNEEKLKTLKMFYKTAIQENDYDMLADYQWMHGVETLEDLKRKIKSRNYYGDDMALPVLEKATGLNATIVKHGKVQKRMDEVQDTDMHILLVLKNVHYRIVAQGKTLVFKTIPQEAISFALKQS